MGADTLYCRVTWDLVLEEPQESFNPRGFGQAKRVRGGGGGGPSGRASLPYGMLLVSISPVICVRMWVSGWTPLSVLEVTWFNPPVLGCALLELVQFAPC